MLDNKLLIRIYADIPTETEHKMRIRCSEERVTRKDFIQRAILNEISRSKAEPAGKKSKAKN